MTTKRKICIACLNRAEYSRLKTVLVGLSARPEIESQTVILKTRYSNNRILFEEDGFPITEEVELPLGERDLLNAARAVGQLTHRLAEVFSRLRPDILIILGDRYEALAAAVAASYLNLFIAHIQGGEITGTIDDHTRHAITKLSHCHFPATPQAAERIIRLGEKPESVHCVGCPGSDLLLGAPMLAFEDLRYKIYRLSHQSEVIEKFTPGFLLFFQFPVTTEFNLVGQQMAATLSAAGHFPQSKIILSSNPDAGGDAVMEAVTNFSRGRNDVLLFKHLPSELFINLMRQAAVMVGNSSAGIRETGYFGLPTVNVGSRQNGRERTRNIIDAPNDELALVEAIKTQLDRGRYPVEQLYGAGRAGEKIVERLLLVDYRQIQKKMNY